MEALLLAAGYGTRLGGVGHGTPKALLPVPGDGRPVLELLVSELVRVPAVTGVRIVTNRRFHGLLEAWLREAEPAVDLPLSLLCDGTRRPEERLGAVGDLAHALAQQELPEELFVSATDSAYDFPLHPFIEEFSRRGATDLLLAVVEEVPELLGQRGVVTLDGEGRVTSLEEKPSAPKSRNTALPLYLFRRRALSLVRTYLERGEDSDALGRLVAWLVPRLRVEGWRAPGGRIDLGDPTNLDGTDAGIR